MVEEMLVYLQTHWAEFLEMTADHLKISGLVTLIAVFLGVPLGVLSSEHDGMYKIFSALFSVLKIIPSLAVLILCIPVLGIGQVSAMAALLLLALPTVLIQTTTGYRGVPAQLLEAASGIGMTRAQCFFWVQTPLALPSVLSGIRTCAVEVISCTTLASYVGAGGLGNLIQIGMSNRFDILLLGGISVAVLAIVVDRFLLMLERKSEYYKLTEPVTIERR